MSSLTGTSVVVVGSGFGGLSAACYLAEAGADVRVLEKNEQLGGRASRLVRDGFSFDLGPSWYLMPDVFERFFGHFGRAPGDYYELERLDPQYRVFFKDGDRIDGVPDLDRMAETFESYETGAGAALRKYLAASERHYEVAMNQFIYEERPRLRDWVDLDVLRAAPVALRLLTTMDTYVASYFDHPKLKQLLQYTLVFLGGAPSNTPALYNLMSHVDLNLGVYYPRGREEREEGSSNGIGAVVDAIVSLASEQGVAFECGAEVQEIVPRENGFHVMMEGGRRYAPDVVVSNADYAHTEQDLLPKQARQYAPEYWRSRTLAPSAFLLYLGVEGAVDPLLHHTLVFPTDWEAHFEQIFAEPAWPDDPAYYVCVPSQTDETVGPDGHSALFVLVPIAPGLDDGEGVREAYRDTVLADLAEHTGVDVRDRIVFEKQFCISDFADRYNSLHGTALGLAHTLRQTAFLRPNRRSTAVEGLYFTGAYPAPGIGVPMCLISGEHTAQAVQEDWG